MNLDRILHQPSDLLRKLSGQRSFLVYMRFNAHLLTLFTAFWMIIVSARLYITQANIDGGEPQNPWSSPWFLLAVALILALTFIATCAIELAPGLNIDERPGFPTALISTIVSSALVIAVGFGFMTVAQTLGDHYSMFYAGIYGFFILTWAVIPFLKRRWVLLIVAEIGVVLAGKLANFDQVLILVCFSLCLFAGMVLTMWMRTVMKELDEAKTAEAALGVSEERLRIAQQLHDSTGQSLAAVSLKTQVIDKLLQREQLSNPTIMDEVAQLKALVGSTSMHMREVVHGYRKVTIDAELAGATALLEDAGKIVTVEGSTQALSYLPTATQQVAAWFIREVSTNIIRHSQAHQVRVRLSSGGINIDNDGATKDVGALSGLAVLNKQAKQHGGKISARRDGQTFITELVFTDHSHGGKREQADHV